MSKPHVPKRVRRAQPLRVVNGIDVVKEQRNAFASMIPTWVKEIGVRGGPYANRFINLHLAFSEWIEDKEPGQGHGKACMQLFSPIQWRKVLSEALPGARTRARKGHKGGSLIMLSAVPLPKVGPTSQRYGVCPTCARPCRIDGKTNMPVAVEQLTSVLEALKREAIAEVGEEKASIPSSRELPYNDKKLSK